MANKPTVVLSFAGDSAKLEKAMGDVGAASDKMKDQIVKDSKATEKATAESADNAEKSFGRLGKAGGAAVAGLGAAGLAAGAAFADSLSFESAQAKLDAQLGNSDYAADIGAAAGELYGKGFGENIGQVNDAMRAVINSGAVMEDATTEQLQGIAGNAMSLAEAFDQDLGKTMEAVGQMVKTGMAKDANEGLDIIARGMQQGVDKSQDFLDTLNEYGTQFRKLGSDGVQATGLLSQGLKAGARDADTVADAIKEFSIRAIDGSKATGEGFKAIGLDAGQMAADIGAGGERANKAFDLTLDKLRGIEDPVARNAAAVGLFGTKAEDLGEALFALDPSEAAAGLGDVGGAAQRLNDTLGDTTENKIKQAQRGFQEWTHDIAGAEGPVGDLAVGVLAFGGGALDAAGSLGTAAIALQNFGLVQKIATAAQWLWNAAMSANPIGLIIIGIAALVAAFIWLWNNVEGFRNFFIDAWHWIQNAAGSTVDWIVDRWNGLIDWFKGIPRKVGDALGSLGDMIGDAFKWGLNKAIDFINWGIDRINSLIHGINVVNPGTDVPDIPKIGRLHTGGTVPGGLGEERLAILEAGETVYGRGESGGGEIRFTSDGSKVGKAILAVVEEAARKQGRTLVGAGR
jgi:phage-related minor tail protein